MIASIQPHADRSLKISSTEHNSFLLSPFWVGWSQQEKFLQDFLVWKCHINEAMVGNVKPIYTCMGMFSFEKQHAGSLPCRTLGQCCPILKPVCHLEQCMSLSESDLLIWVCFCICFITLSGQMLLNLESVFYTASELYSIPKFIVSKKERGRVLTFIECLSSALCVLCFV